MCLCVCVCVCVCVGVRERDCACKVKGFFFLSYTPPSCSLPVCLVILAAEEPSIMCLGLFQSTPLSPSLTKLVRLVIGQVASVA